MLTIRPRANDQQLKAAKFCIKALNTWDKSKYLRILGCIGLLQQQCSDVESLRPLANVWQPFSVHQWVKPHCVSKAVRHSYTNTYFLILITHYLLINVTNTNEALETKQCKWEIKRATIFDTAIKKLKKNHLTINDCLCSILVHTGNPKSRPRARRLSERWMKADSSSWRQWLGFLILWHRSTVANPHNSSFEFARWQHRTDGLATKCNCMFWLGVLRPNLLSPWAPSNTMCPWTPQMYLPNGIWVHQTV